VLIGLFRGYDYFIIILLILLILLIINININIIIIIGNLMGNFYLASPTATVFLKC